MVKKNKNRKNKSFILKTHKKQLLVSLLAFCIVLISILYFTNTFSIKTKIHNTFGDYTVAVPSVDIDHNKDNPGGYHIEKSAKWIGAGTARVTWNLSSKIKADDNYKDIVIVLDISGSMSGEKLDKAKEDAKALINEVLSDNHNKIALITFESDSTVESNLTNDKNTLINKIDSLTSTGCTNYNKGLLNVDTVLNNYQKQSNRDLITLFMTDGYPNEETPNEVATYELLKDKYPYMAINGIQYEMGKDIIDEIKRVTDNQWVADMNDLNNIIFEASIAPIVYENFVIEDYIDSGFEVLSEEDIKVPFGTVTLTEENGLQKVTWNLGNKYVTGSTYQMTIDLEVKNIYNEQEGYYPTNDHEKITSKLPDESENINNTSVTPVLKGEYTVTYDPNSPDISCDLSSYEDEETHFVYQNVNKKTTSLSCNGYSFKGWQIETSGVKIINDDVFIMPEKDVLVRGTWTKISVDKSMDGTVHKKIRGKLMMHNSTTSQTFGKSISRDSFESITTINNDIVPSAAIDSWDVSEEQNSSVIAWYTDENSNGRYELYIGQDGGVIANSNSSYAFYYFKNAKLIDLSYFDTSYATDMDAMFAHAGTSAGTFNLIGLSDWNTSNVINMSDMFGYTCRSATTCSLGDLSDWNTSDVTDMSSMFYEAGYRATAWSVGDLSGWDTSKVTNMRSMFSSAGYSATTWSVGDLSGWDTGEVTNMDGMFSLAGHSATTWSVGDLSGWDTSNVTNMRSMFSSTGYSATSWNLGDLSNWDTSNVTNMSYMFANAGKNVSSFNIVGISDWNTSEVTCMDSMFEGAGYKSTTFSLDISDWNTSNVTSMKSMFMQAGYNATSWSVGNLSTWNTSKVVNMSMMFYSTGYNSTVFNISYIGNWNTSNVTDMGSMFYSTGYNSTTFDIGNLSTWNTSNVTSMSCMFQYAGYSATTWKAIGTLKIYATNIYRIFYYCPGAKATLNIYSNPESGGSGYSNSFGGAATDSSALITVNYSSTCTNIDNIIATKSSNSNVVKGILLP